jgi:hypothetical protein
LLDTRYELDAGERSRPIPKVVDALSIEPDGVPTAAASTAASVMRPEVGRLLGLGLQRRPRITGSVEITIAARRPDQRRQDEIRRISTALLDL